MNKSIIEKIKNHIFLESHILHEGILRFDSEADMAAAWQRLIDCNYDQSDLHFLQHELAELLLMNGQDLSWTSTHHTVNKIYNWEHNL